MSPKPRPKQVEVPEISFLEKELGTYTNHVQVSITNNELILDFFFISPDLQPTQPQKTGPHPAKAIHVQRVIAPLTLAKGLTSALANVIAQYEADHLSELPNTRIPQPDDLLTIWPSEVNPPVEGNHDE